uniref:RPAP1_C domain-containing protein n=1 Tax=Macrostomum lignano TaxID=282301 RepID=A0A1I8FMD7_9PLAT
EDRRCEWQPRSALAQEGRGVALDAAAGDPRPSRLGLRDLLRARAPTNAHGKIKFRDFGRSSSESKPRERSMDALWALLTDKDKAAAQSLASEFERYDYAKGDDDEVADDRSGRVWQRRAEEKPTPGHGVPPRQEPHALQSWSTTGPLASAAGRFGLRTELEKFVVTKMREVKRGNAPRAICSIPTGAADLRGRRQVHPADGREGRRRRHAAVDRRSADKLAWASEVRAAAASAAAAMNAESTEARVRQRIKEMAAEYVNTSGPQERRALERALFRFAYPSEEALPARPARRGDPGRGVPAPGLQRPDLNTQMMLAMAWDRADIAEARILSGLSKQRLKELNLSRMMARALMAQQVGFVQLFMTFGVSASAVLTRGRLERLYL